MKRKKILVKCMKEHQRNNPDAESNQRTLADFSPQITAPKPDDEWGFAGAKTRYGTHGMHTWLAAMIPQVAQRCIRITKAKTVLDPFCGGGTVLVEASLRGLPAWGVDINPLAVLVTKAKTTQISPSTLNKELRRILGNAHESSVEPISFPKESMIHYWYKPYMIQPLTALRHEIDLTEEEDVRTFFQCVFSATARDVSLTHRGEIRLRRLEPEKLESFNPDIFKRFRYRARDSIKRLTSLKTDTQVRVKHENVLRLPFEDNQFSTIVCSPPYGDERNGVPYFQFAKNMLFWLGFDRQLLFKFKHQTLGWVGTRKTIPLPPSQTLKSLIEEISDHSRSVLEATAFYHDYHLALQEMVRVTSDKIAIVIGQRVLRNKVFDNAQITVELLANLGVDIFQRFIRKLPSKRLPKMREHGAAINKEHILIFSTPKT